MSPQIKVSMLAAVLTVQLSAQVGATDGKTTYNCNQQRYYVGGIVRSVCLTNPSDQARPQIAIPRTASRSQTRTGNADGGATSDNGWRRFGSNAAIVATRPEATRQKISGVSLQTESGRVAAPDWSRSSLADSGWHRKRSQLIVTPSSQQAVSGGSRWNSSRNPTGLVADRYYNTTSPRTVTSRLTEALFQIDRGDYKRAKEIIDRSSWDKEAAFAAFVVSLAMLNGVESDRAYRRLELTDQEHFDQLARMETWALIRSLYHDHSPSQKWRVGKLLADLATEFPHNRFARSAVLSYNAKVLKGDRLALAVVLEQTQLTRQRDVNTNLRLDDVERQLVLNQDQLNKLNSEARRLFQAVGATEQRMSSFESRIILDEEQLRALDVRTQRSLGRLSDRLSELTQLIAQKDSRTVALVNSLRDELRNNALARQGSPLYTSQVLENWQVRPANLVAQDIVSLSNQSKSTKPSTFLRSLGNYVSVGPSIGILHINLVAVLAKLAEWVGA